MTREEFIKQRCEIDKITEEEFEKRYRVVKCNCGQPYCKGYRCLDLDGLLKENQELKKQLEEYKATNKILSHELTKDKVLQQDCLTTCCGIPIGDIPKLITQQKEFIKYLEDEKDRLARICNNLGEDKFDEADDILQKYKEVIDKAIEELKKGLHELDIRRREEVYIEQYIEEALNMLKEVE
jgi:hypothetical protein